MMEIKDVPIIVVKDVIPYIEGHYQVMADKENRALAGLSILRNKWKKK